MHLLDETIICSSRLDRIEIFPFYDAHIGKRNCDEVAIRKEVQEVLKRDTMPNRHARVVFGGDICDVIKPQDIRFDINEVADWVFQGEADDIRERLNDIAKHQVLRAAQIFDPIKHLILGAIEANHDKAVRKRYNTDTHRGLCDALQIRDMTDEAIIRFKFKRLKQTSTIKLYLRHGYGGGRTPGTEPNKIARMLGDGVTADCDVCLTGHCFSKDTELLTTSGWKRYDTLEEGETIYNFDIAKESIEIDTINKVFVYDNYTKLHHLKNLHTDLLLTDKHTLVYRYRGSRKGKTYRHRWLKKPVDFFDNKRFNIDIPCAGVMTQDDFPILSDAWIELLGLLISEGSFKTYGRAKSRVQLYQREGNEAYMEDVLNRCDIYYTKYIAQTKGKKFYCRGRWNRQNTNAITFHIAKESALKIRERISSKQIPPYAFSFSRRQFTLLLKALIYGDGSRISDKACVYYSGDSYTLSTLQALCTIFGYRTTLNTKRGELYITDTQTTNITTGKSQPLNIVDYSGDVWCCNTNNGTLIVRRNGRVSIVGNTHTYCVPSPEPVLYIPSKGKLPPELLTRYRFGANPGCWLLSHKVGLGGYESSACYPSRAMMTLKIVVWPFWSTTRKSYAQELPKIEIRQYPIL